MTQAPRVRLRPTLDSKLPWVLETERDPANTPFIGQWSPEEHLAAMADPNVGHYTVESIDDGAPLGHLIAIGLQNTRSKVHLKRFVIAHRGEGYGRQALRAFRGLAFAQLDFTCIWLNVYQSNPRAQKLYRSEGFVEIGLSPAERHLVMSLRREGCVG